MIWTDRDISALVGKVLAAMPKADPLPFPVPIPTYSASYAPKRRWAARKRVWELTGGRCAYCHAPLDSKFEVDHVVPRFMGGPDRKVNMLPCCYGCNVQKGGGLPRVAA
jgi:5-methylcytosine-specific restriction endonuclease McrA